MQLDGQGLVSFIATYSIGLIQVLIHPNGSKMKDMIIGFRKSPPSPLPTVIKGADIDPVEGYTYLSIVLDNALCFESHEDATSQKGPAKTFCLWKVNFFNVSLILR